MKGLRKDNKGFTLVEMIVVLVILAILAAILVPALLGYIDEAKANQVTLHGKTVYTAAQTVASKYYGKTSGNNIHPKDDESDADLQKYIDDVKVLSEIDSFGDASATVYFSSNKGQGGYKVSGIDYTENGVTMHMTTKDNEWVTGYSSNLNNGITISSSSFSPNTPPPAPEQPSQDD